MALIGPRSRSFPRRSSAHEESRAAMIAASRAPGDHLPRILRSSRPPLERREPGDLRSESSANPENLFQLQALLSWRAVGPISWCPADEIEPALTS